MGLKMGARGRVLLPKALPRAQGFELGAQDLTISSFLKGGLYIYIYIYKKKLYVDSSSHATTHQSNNSAQVYTTYGVHIAVTSRSVQRLTYLVTATAMCKGQ